MNLSFAGCGFLGVYHIGVACCFRKYAPHLLLNNISGASAGAIAACCLLCDVPLGDITSTVLRVAHEARKRALGPFSPSFNINSILLEGLEKTLPEDAHLRVNGKVHVSLTRLRDGKNVIISHFETRTELINTLLASCFIPIFSGLLPPKFNGVRYMDGGYSDNLPTLDENTITVSPFCGESDICPRDDSSQLFHINIANTSIELSKHNIYRMIRILFPPRTEILSNMCKQGFDDALRFLHRNNLINCTRCLAVQSTFVVTNKIDDNQLEYDPQCHECKLHRQEALISNVPDTVLTIFQEAIDSANKGLMNWLFKHRGMKLISVLTLPYTVPADIMYATFTKLNILPKKITKPIPTLAMNKFVDFNLLCLFGNQIETKSFQLGQSVFLSECNSCMSSRFMSAAPQIGNGVWDLSKYFMDQCSYILNKLSKNREQVSAKLTCQVAVTEYTDDFDIEIPEDSLLSTTNKMNLNFTLNLDERDLPIEEHPEDKFTTNKLSQRQPSFTFSRTDFGDPDTFEHILEVTRHHENVLTYYYMDENNKMKVTEIYDVTESESPVVQTINEKDTNNKLEYDDDDWDEWACNPIQQEEEQQQTILNENNLSIDDKRNSLAELSEYSVEFCDKDTSNLYSDTESEWTQSYKIEEPEDEESLMTLQPESDQSTTTIKNCKNLIRSA